MNRQLVTVSSSDPVVMAAYRRMDHGVHRLLVIDDRTLAGIVTAFDLLARVAMPAPHDACSAEQGMP
jgi:CBS domain-containing protein